MKIPRYSTGDALFIGSFGILIGICVDMLATFVVGCR